MVAAPSIKEALEIVENLIRRDPACFNLSDELLPVRSTLRALATFQPDGERRDAIARALHQRRYGKWYEGPCAPTDSQRECLEEADWLLASGLVQDEAGVRADMVLVPAEPTPDMRIAGGIAWADALPSSETYVDTADACYKAMLAVAQKDQQS